MQSKENLHQSLLAAFNLKLETNESPEVAARAITDILCAFAEVVMGPTPEIAGVELAVDDTQAQLLAELRNVVGELKSLRRDLAPMTDVATPMAPARESTSAIDVIGMARDWAANAESTVRLYGIPPTRPAGLITALSNLAEA